MQLRSQVTASITSEDTASTFLDGTAAELSVLLRLANGALSLKDYVQQNHTECTPTLWLTQSSWHAAATKPNMKRADELGWVGLRQGRLIIASSRT
jgi:hypothetical protein